jgi:Mn-containing catalase
LNCEDPDRKNLLMDIGTEELSHLEVVGCLARLRLKPTKFDREKAEADPLIAIAGGGGVNLFNSQGNPWTADYLKITGELDVDLRTNIAAEARAKIVYERLINFCDDAGTKDALQFLMTREITHMKAFAAALESMKKPAFSIGKIAPTPGLVNQFFNDSTGTGDEGEIDTRGPWNEGGDWELMSSPALSTIDPAAEALIKTESSPPTAPEGISELLVDELRDILHAEKQLTKALPKMAARFVRLRECFEEHLAETEAQIERLIECFSLLGETAREALQGHAGPCRRRPGGHGGGRKEGRCSRQCPRLGAGIAFRGIAVNPENTAPDRHSRPRDHGALDSTSLRFFKLFENVRVALSCKGLVSRPWIIP